MGGGCIKLFSCAWDPFAPIGLPFSGLILECVPSHITYSHSHVWVISLGGMLFFPEEKQRKRGSGGERMWEEEMGGMEEI